MRIAFIGQKGIPAKAGGVEKHVEELSSRLVKHGHEVFVYVRNNYTDKNIAEYKGVKLIHLPCISTKNLDAISHTFLATMHALFCRYDIIHYQAIGPSSLSFLIRLFKPLAFLVSTFHCQDYFHQKWGFWARCYLKFGEFITCKIPHKTIAISRILQKYSWKKYGIRAAFIPNGATVAATDEKDALARWNLTEKKYVLFVGRLIQHKGAHYLIEAFKKLEDARKMPPDFKLVIVGDGFHTDNYVKRLRQISAGRKNIIFTGAQTGKTLIQIFSHAYLFVQPSESEGLSLALLEAMGYGLAPLVSDIPENLEAIGQAGLVFRNKSIDDLREKMENALNESEKIKIIGECAKEREEKEYDWDSIALKTLRLYENLINSKKNSFYVWKSKRI